MAQTKDFPPPTLKTIHPFQTSNAFSVTSPPPCSSSKFSMPSLTFFHPCIYMFLQKALIKIMPLPVNFSSPLFFPHESVILLVIIPLRIPFPRYPFRKMFEVQVAVDFPLPPVLALSSYFGRPFKLPIPFPNCTYYP